MKSRATITVQNFSENGSINFRVDMTDCNDSAGRFEYEYDFIDPTSGVRDSRDRRQTWTRTHSNASFTVSDDAPIGGAKLVAVRVLDHTIDFDCFG